MLYPARLIANALLWKARQEGASLDHMQLQKLAFFVHAWGLSLKVGPVVGGGFEAWNYGPVSIQLYHELKHFGTQPVTNYLVEVDSRTGTTMAKVPSKEDVEFWNLLDQVWARYAKMNTGQLSALSREPGGPWEQFRGSLEEAAESFHHIPEETIREFYACKLAN